MIANHLAHDSVLVAAWARDRRVDYPRGATKSLPPATIESAKQLPPARIDVPQLPDGRVEAPQLPAASIHAPMLAGESVARAFVVAETQSRRWWQFGAFYFLAPKDDGNRGT